MFARWPAVIVPDSQGAALVAPLAARRAVAAAEVATALAAAARAAAVSRAEAAAPPAERAAPAERPEVVAPAERPAGVWDITVPLLRKSRLRPSASNHDDQRHEGRGHEQPRERDQPVFDFE